jgi:hypothetical protein
MHAALVVLALIGSAVICVITTWTRTGNGPGKPGTDSLLHVRYLAPTALAFLNVGVVLLVT